MSSKKVIDINGQNNRYLVKKANAYKSIPKQRNEYLELTEIIDLSFISQLCVTLHESLEQSDNQKYIINQVQKKLNSYTAQDKQMKRYNRDYFISLIDVFEKIKVSENKCFYCSTNLLINYKFGREPKQWTLERKDNNIQHNNDNCVIACLECNLKRRNTNYDAFKYTKQMTIVKKD
jgi:hypothetical protein